MSGIHRPPETTPSIVAPVSRFLAVCDLARSLAFYHDVLGFDVPGDHEKKGNPAQVEVVSGPAKIELGVAETAPDSTGQSRPRGSAILFFQTDDVHAMHDALIARDGHPSEIVKVNWIKMSMFEIRDPDGHSLWFGQSFQQPSAAPDHKQQLRKALPELPVDDVEAAVAYYRDVLGFHVNYAQHDLGVMDRDAVTVLLIARTARHTGIGSCYMYIRDADALHAELVARGATVLCEPVSHPWGLRDFEVLDLVGNRLRFGQTFE
jgi:catechol 2,3-dioxygenase-like lactoylglutathione lyase family enzyme